jgi:acetylornithine/succinyldiaminopimelate/putrescine aminotransferase
MSTLRQHFLRYQAQTSPAPLLLEIEKAEGLYMTDRKGKRYADLISGIAVSNLGHGHPAVKEAVKAQVDRHAHLMVFGEFAQQVPVKLAKALAKSTNYALDSVFFVNSGSEATEGALKLAKRYTGRTEFIAFRDAYHGSSLGALSACGNMEFSKNARPLVPGFRHFNFNESDAADAINANTAAVLVEPIQGEAGVRPAQKAFLKKLRKACDAYGALLIFDEIQSGFGRTGTFWAHEQYDVQPDILLTAKGMGAGYPIGAFMARREVMQSLTHDPVLGHITTFGGNAVTAAASLAALKIIRKKKFLQNVQQNAIALEEEVKKLPHVQEVRSKGLMMAAELGDSERLFKAIDLAVEEGLITDWFLFCDTAMRIAPPLNIKKRELRDVLARLKKALKKL